jgi:hypothetical protein
LFLVFSFGSPAAEPWSSFSFCSNAFRLRSPGLGLSRCSDLYSLPLASGFDAGSVTAVSFLLCSRGSVATACRQCTRLSQPATVSDPRCYLPTESTGSRSRRWFLASGFCCRRFRLFSAGRSLGSCAWSARKGFVARALQEERSRISAPREPRAQGQVPFFRARLLHWIFARFVCSSVSSAGPISRLVRRHPTSIFVLVSRSRRRCLSLAGIVPLIDFSRWISMPFCLLSLVFSAQFYLVRCSGLGKVSSSIGRRQGLAPAICVHLLMCLNCVLID